MGLVWFLKNRRVADLTPKEATIRCANGSILKFYRRTEPVMKVAPTSTKVTTP
jgi:hypothetical protein